MKRLYDYLMNPRTTIQLYNHQKDWRLWWIILTIGSFLSMIKWSSIGLITFLAVLFIQVAVLIFFATIIDASAQFLGQQGQLKTIIYWLGFSQTIFWIMPSLEIIQTNMLTMGSLLILALNIIYIGYIWITLRQIYQKSAKYILAILIMPLIMIILVVTTLIIWVTTQAMVF